MLTGNHMPETDFFLWEERRLTNIPRKCQRKAVSGKRGLFKAFLSGRPKGTERGVAVKAPPLSSPGPAGRAGTR